MTGGGTRRCISLVQTRVPARQASALAVESAVEQHFQDREGTPGAIIRTTPIDPHLADPVHWNIHGLRDELGLLHFQGPEVIAAIEWPEETTRRARVPTMVDGEWAVFRPDPDAGWGHAVNLSSGARGRPEAVLDGGAVSEGRHSIVRRRRRPGWWPLTLDDATTRLCDRGDDGLYGPFCQRLLGLIGLEGDAVS